jgi:DNA-binding beta-propeller fold protein YncE
VDFPDGKETENVGFQYSPDGKTLYFFTDDIIAVNADTYEEVERWEISKPLEPGLGRASFGVGPGTYDRPGVATSLYRMTDPAQNRRLMGVAQVRLSEKKVDFFTVGDAQPLRGFALAPDGDFAYSLLSEVGRYEFWEFDLKNRKLARRHEVAGRPRMGIRASADGKKLYIFVAGNTIDVYDRATFQLLRTVTFDEDMTSTVVIAGGGGS